jgi:hypothetical protein
VPFSSVSVLNRLSLSLKDFALPEGFSNAPNPRDIFILCLASTVHFHPINPFPFCRSVPLPWAILWSWCCHSTGSGSQLLPALGFYAWVRFCSGYNRTTPPYGARRTGLRAVVKESRATLWDNLLYPGVVFKGSTPNFYRFTSHLRSLDNVLHWALPTKELWSTRPRTLAMR